MPSLPDLLTARAPRNGTYLTVCVDGRGGSGKTTLGELLRGSLPGWTVVHGDDYFEPHDDPVTWGGFNEERFEGDVLRHVRAGDRTIPWRPYDFPRGAVGAEQRLTVGPGLLLERWLGLALDVPWDVTIWVDTPAATCLARGLARVGGQALGERARLAWETVWQPREEQHIRDVDPLRTADLVVDGTVPFGPQLGLGEPGPLAQRA